MFCTRCGKEIKAGARFCGNCGMQVVQAGTGGNVGTGATPPIIINQPQGSRDYGPIQLDTSNIVKKVIYLVLVVVALILSFSKVIDISGYVSMTYSELVKYIKQLATFAAMWGENTSGTGIYSLGLFCLRLGTIAIVTGAILVFVKPKYSYGFNFSGAILNIVAMAIILMAIRPLSEMLDVTYSEGLSIITGGVWLFIIINIAIMIISSPGQIYESEFDYTYAGKRYDHLEKAYKDKEGTWICSCCGKQNNSSLSYCSCGQARTGYVRRY